MVIDNIDLTERERIWLENMLKSDFFHKEEMILQINHSKITREYFGDLISLKFSVDRKISPMDIHVRVPLEMRVYQNNKPPIQFLLHVINGYIDELEVFYADSSYIDNELSIINDSTVEVITSN